MNTGSGHSHRSTLKQSNKKFKSKHATKSSIKTNNKGKVQRSKITSASKVSAHKADRRNAAKIEQQKKRNQVLANARLFQGSSGVPRIIAVVPLCPDVNAYEATKSLFGSREFALNHGSAILNIPKLRSKLQFIPTPRNLLRILDAVKVADMVIFVLSSNEEVDSFGETTMRAIKTQGVPFVLSVVQNLNSNPPKKQMDIRKSLLYYMNHHFPGDHRLFSTEVENDCDACLRYLASSMPKPISWRGRHTYLLPDKIDFVPSSESSEMGNLSVSGYIRGHKLNPNHLIHLINYGDFQIESIKAAIAPTSQQRKTTSMDSSEEDGTLARPDPSLQESLVQENEPDLMDAEQTWPTEEELQEADDRVRALRESGDVDDDHMDADMPRGAFGAASTQKKRVPKGTSSYQAAWIFDEEDENEEDENGSEFSDDEEMTMKMQYEDLVSEEEDSASEEYEDVDLEDRNELMNDLDEEEDEQQRQEYLSRRQASKSDLEFPDEVDTPLHVPARERFQRYRGLKSFRSSPWDPYENLPLDYGRIFQFQNFKRNRQRVLKSLEEGKGVDVGTYVTIVIKDVPSSIIADFPQDTILPVFTLVPNEAKYTVVNFVIQRHDGTPQNPGYSEPIKSKDPMVLHCGFRRYIVQPIYSTYTRGGANNVHRFERYLQSGRASVGTVYAPIQYGPAPIMMFKHDENNGWTDFNPPIYIGSGSVLDSDPLRIIAKRILLTGHPYKVHKRSAVIRYMFFNPEDVLYFKPVQLTTKLGRTGHIKESLGTHGYMKCVFDGPLKQHDTVCMSLYKRVFPKWTTRVFVEGGVGASSEVKEMEVE